jgi:hypothetical protein
MNNRSKTTPEKVKSKAKQPTANPEESRARNPNVLQIGQLEGESEGWAHSRAMASPRTNAGMTMFQFHPLRQGGNITDLVEQLGNQATAIRSGNMDRPEAMLVAQAHTLDTIFNALAQRSALNLNAGHMQVGETYLRLALKAQSQCRSTLEALAELKYPKSAMFIKQANIANQQQVNNGGSTSALPQEIKINPSNELLEATHGQRLDFGAASAAISPNQNLESMGIGDRAGDQRREG